MSSLEALALLFFWQTSAWTSWSYFLMGETLLLLFLCSSEIGSFYFYAVFLVVQTNNPFSFTGACLLYHFTFSLILSIHDTSLSFATLDRDVKRNSLDSLPVLLRWLIGNIWCLTVNLMINHK